MKNHIAIYGTGIDGRRIYRSLIIKKNLKIFCFFDTDVKNHKKKNIWFNNLSSETILKYIKKY